MLPFTAEILFSDFAQSNRALWPFPILAWGLGLAAILLTLRPLRGGDAAIGALLAAGWLWTGIGYHILHFATINFAAPLYGAVFALEGLLLAWSGVLRQTLSFRFRPDPFGWAGLALALAALILWPLADWLTGHGAGGMRVVGLAPTPTAAFTLGLLLLTEAGRRSASRSFPSSGRSLPARPAGSSASPRIWRCRRRLSARSA
jgi:hypothetical protein